MNLDSPWLGDSVALSEDGPYSRERLGERIVASGIWTSYGAADTGTEGSSSDVRGARMH